MCNGTFDDDRECEHGDEDKAPDGSCFGCILERSVRWIPPMTYIPSKRVVLIDLSKLDNER